MKAAKFKEYKGHLSFIAATLDMVTIAAGQKAISGNIKESLSRLASEASDRLMKLNGIVVGTQKGGNGHGPGK